MTPAIVLLSGGIDSTTALASTIAAGHPTYALTIDYHQRHRDEIGSAHAVAHQLGAVEHRIVEVSFGDLARSPLTDFTEPVPTGRHPDEIADDPSPATYVPGRNTIFLSLALAWAETVGAHRIVIGATAEDQAGYPDCRPEFLQQWSLIANLGTNIGHLEVHAPFAHMTKAEVLTLGLELGVDYTYTWSCYRPAVGRPCNLCDACVLRKAAFAAIRHVDPALL